MDRFESKENITIGRTDRNWLFSFTTGYAELGNAITRNFIILIIFIPIIEINILFYYSAMHVLEHF